MLDFLFSIDFLTNPIFVSNCLIIYGKLSSSRGYSIIRKSKKCKICLKTIAEIVGKKSQNSEIVSE